MRTVAQQWTEFAALVMPKDAPEIQAQEMRRAFYAGFHGALVASLELAEEFHQECRDFGRAISEGRA